MIDRADSEPIRVVFCGTPEFAVPALRALFADARFDVVLAVTQPDRPAGRGRKLVMPAVKAAALDLGVPVHQPVGLRSEAERLPLVDARAGVFVVAAYGVIFGAKTLAIPRFGCLNLHASILPAYRGASPISAAIAERENRTGVTLMRMERGLDTGPMLGTRSLDIRPDDTTASLTARLAEVGALLAVDLIPGVVTGDVRPVPQAGTATLTRPLVKADGWLDWKRPAAELEAQVRAMWPWPRAWTTAGADSETDRILQVHRASLVEGSTDPVGPAGAILVDGHADVVVATGDGLLRLETVQEAGGRPLAASALRRSSRLEAGEILGGSGAPDRRSPLVTTIPA